ncbi:hypothetical protein BpHYR1_051833 [Brachionus plicatilis]|uniref:RNA-directed DNA polymerase from mobile element jockey-like n=1 Tax=Brachionus plicatilis TaxID=10195 RepID=A0A3M7RT65_BRAPC|nr:hypothetical protein BpHYR1_051833 [Brachionus plicatilis]
MKKIVKPTNHKGAVGPDQISNKVLKNLPYPALKVLYLLCVTENWSLSNNVEKSKGYY